MTDAAGTGTWSCVEGGALEVVACPVCAETGCSAVLRRPDGLDIVACRDCGLYYVNPQPTQEALAAYYAGGYFEGEHDFYRGRSYFESRLEGLNAGSLTGWDFVRGRCGDLSGKVFMDLGCASGEMLVLARNSGAAAVRGIELDDKAANHGRSAYGLDIRIGTIESELHEEGSVDVITAFDVVEHLKAPLLAFQRIAAALRPGGQFLCGTPNGACIERWGAEWIGAGKDFEHLLFPRAADLRRIAGSVGLELVHHETRDNPLPMREYAPGGDRAARLCRQPDVVVHNARQKLRLRFAGSGCAHTLYAALRKPGQPGADARAKVPGTP
ncbi:MAG TPA: class I SAM-dependent methyltransferase [Burkholderiales bacterium]|nr:class I SAM-dependent methyltransferase [Burkholderiales bacterium]